jgi:hypothetical protein
MCLFNGCDQGCYSIPSSVISSCRSLESVPPSIPPMNPDAPKTTIDGILVDWGLAQATARQF